MWRQELEWPLWLSLYCFPGKLCALYGIFCGNTSGGPKFYRRYFTCLLFVPFNVYATYYLQAVQRVRESLLVSLLHSFLLGSAFLYLFPLFFGSASIWNVMFFAELITAIIASGMLGRSRAEKTVCNASEKNAL